jgi:hypothetical protein
MRRAFGIAFVASLVLLAPVIAQIGGRPMVIIAGQVLGPASYDDPDRNFVMRQRGALGTQSECSGEC